MAYDRQLAERIRKALAGHSFREVNMFGGLSFLINEKLDVSATTQGDLMIRCDPQLVDELVHKPGAAWAEMRGQKMKKGWLRIDATGTHDEQSLAFWINTALQHNEKAANKTEG